MTEATKYRATAFIRTIASNCNNCFRRDEFQCNSCFSRTAKSILRDIMSEEGDQKEVDYSLYARMERIKSVLEEANRPLLSQDINISDLCSFQLKLFTLKKMVKLGIIGRRVAFRKKLKNYFYYFLKDKGNDK